MKAFVQRGLEIRRALQRDDLDDLHRRIRQSSDLKEGLAAQREKRRPVFKGN